jgi:accessory gene regulator protein AgrB
MHCIALRCVSALVEQGYLDKARTEWYVYAIERRLGYCLAGVWLIAVAFVLHAPLQTALFFGSAVFLRARTGGWHAKSVGACQLLSMLTTLVVVWAVGAIPAPLRMPISAVVLPVCIAIVWHLAPINHANIHLTQKECDANRVLSRYRAVLLCVLCGVLHLIAPQSALGLSVTAGIAVASAGIVMGHFIKEDISNES